MALTKALVIATADLLTAARLRALGTDASTYGLGAAGATSRAYGAAAAIGAAVVATGDLDLIASLVPATRQLRDGVAVDAALAQAWGVFVRALDVEASRSGLTSVGDLDSFAAYYNVTDATKWGCLLPPDWIPLYRAARSASPSAINVYAEVLQGATFANGMRKLVVATGVQSAGQGIDPTAYAGGFGQVKVSGLAGSGTVTVTGTWRDPAAPTSAKAGAGTAAVSGNGTVVLTPPFSSALLVTATDLAVTAGITAGTIYAEAQRPAGRTNPPA